MHPMKIFIMLFAMLCSNVALAEITCEAVEKAAKKIYTSIYNAQLASHLEEGKALTQAFWTVSEIAPDCPVVKSYAEVLRGKNLTADATSTRWKQVFCTSGKCDAPALKNVAPGGFKGYIVEDTNRLIVVPSLEQQRSDRVSR